MEIPSINPNKSPKQVHDQVSRIAGNLIDRATEVTAQAPEVNEHERMTAHKIAVDSPSEPSVSIEVSSGEDHAVGGDSVYTSKNGDSKYVGKTSSAYGENVFVAHSPADKDSVIGDSYKIFEQKPRLIGPKKHSTTLNVDALGGKIPQSIPRTLGGIRSDISEAKQAQKAQSK